MAQPTSKRPNKQFVSQDAIRALAEEQLDQAFRQCSQVREGAAAVRQAESAHAYQADVWISVQMLSVKQR